MKKLRRALVVGAVIGIFYFGWYLRSFYGQNWRFNIFSWDNWRYVWNEFRSGWVINTTGDWIFVITVLLMIPAFMLIWWGSYQIQWRKSFMIVFRKVKSFFFRPNPNKIIKNQVKIKAKASHKKVRPRPIASVGRPSAKVAGRTMDAAFAEPATVPAAPAPTPMAEPIPVAAPEAEETIRPAFMDEDISNMPLDQIQLPEPVRLEEDLVAILFAGNYQVVKDVQLNKLFINYIGIATDKVVLCLTDTEKGDWLADEEFFNDEEPLWFSESSHRISPVYQLRTEAGALAQKLKSAGLAQEVFPLLIEKNGTIINAADMGETWKRQGVVVCRTDLGGPEELPSFEQALPKAIDKGDTALLDAVRDLF